MKFSQIVGIFFSFFFQIDFDFTSRVQRSWGYTKRYDKDHTERRKKCIYCVIIVSFYSIQSTVRSSVREKRKKNWYHLISLVQEDFGYRLSRCATAASRQFQKIQTSSLTRRRMNSIFGFSSNKVFQVRSFKIFRKSETAEFNSVRITCCWQKSEREEEEGTHVELQWFHQQTNRERNEK